MPVISLFEMTKAKAYCAVDYWVFLQQVGVIFTYHYQFTILYPLIILSQFTHKSENTVRPRKKKKKKKIVGLPSSGIFIQFENIIFI